MINRSLRTHDSLGVKDSPNDGASLVSDMADDLRYSRSSWARADWCQPPPGPRRPACPPLIYRFEPRDTSVLVSSSAALLQCKHKK